MSESGVFSKQFPHFQNESRVALERHLEQILNDLGKSTYFSNLSYIVSEIVGNSDKANLKRALFIQNRLDIHDPNDYARGIQKLRDAISNNLGELLKIVEEKNFFIKVDFTLRDGKILISVVNNNTLLPIERQRIDDRFQIARKFSSIDEVFAEGLDQTEGGGFGLIISILMLRKLGATERSIRYVSDHTTTQVSVEIPLDFEEDSLLEDLDDGADLVEEL